MNARRVVLWGTSPFYIKVPNFIKLTLYCKMIRLISNFTFDIVQKIWIEKSKNHP